MRTRRLLTRFVLAGCLLVATTVGTGVWSALTFARLSAAADNALAESREKIDLTAALAGSLEREDDALLLALSGDAGRAVRELAAERRRGDDAYGRLLAALDGEPAGGRSAALNLREEMDRYRAAGSELVAGARRPDGLERYHRHVNPLLRQAVAACGQIREETFESLRRAGVRARDEAGRATWVVAGVSVAAVVLATAVSVWLARSVVRPVRALRECVEAVRQGDFGRRASPAPADELGQLAEGLNRMTETLAEYRSSSLGELLAAKMTLEATLNALPDAVIVVAPDGTLATVNPPAQEVLEAARAGAPRRLADLPLRPEHRRAVEAALAGRPALPARTDFGLALTAAVGGRPCRFLLRAVPVPEFAPRRCGAVIVLDDVTEFARLDELRAELIGVASHELKTPLTTVRMNLLMLGEEAGGLSGRQREMLAAALGGCEDLGGTIDELLDMTRIEAGQLRLDLAPVDLAAVLEQALRPLGPYFEDAGARLKVVREGGRAVARGDAARLRLVLSNLLTNALKYSPPGGTVTVRIASGQNAGPDGAAALQVAVTDEGPGVPAELRERVFEKFFRVEHHLGGGPNGVRGTGIGLYLCREIVKAHGGAIRCEAGEGGAGTRVALTLPADAPAG
jgi:NtrC-family two-component system sensor histidine kinase KinB